MSLAMTRTNALCKLIQFFCSVELMMARTMFVRDRFWKAAGCHLFLFCLSGRFDGQVRKRRLVSRDGLSGLYYTRHRAGYGLTTRTRGSPKGMGLSGCDGRRTVLHVLLLLFSTIR